MKRLRYINNGFLLLITLLLPLSSCNKSNVSAYDGSPYTLLPGDCLCDPGLKFEEFCINNFSTSEEQSGLKMYTLTFRLNFSCKTEYISYLEDTPKNYRVVPSESVYEKFGINAEIVKERYEQCWTDFFKNTGRWWDATTIFLDSEAKLIADKKIAGFNPGENIVAKTLDYEKWRAIDNPETPFYYGLNPRDYLELPIETKFPYQYSLSSDRISIAIPWMGNSMELVDDVITFTFEMPVKVGLYLTWLNETISNPDASFTCRDETLTCTFTVPKGLH